MKLLDILLLPRRLYLGLTDRKSTLYLGILFIGLADIALPYLKDNYAKLYMGKPSGTLVYNIILTIAFIVMLGFVDVLFFTIPLFDLFKVFKEEKEIFNAGDLRIKVAKVYITAHIVIVPVNVILYFAFRNISSSMLLAQLAAYIVLLVWIWFSAIISRGINVIYSFQPRFKRLVFLAVFLWSLLLGAALEYMIGHWMMALFR